VKTVKNLKKNIFSRAFTGAAGVRAPRLRGAGGWNGDCHISYECEPENKE